MDAAATCTEAAEADTTASEAEGTEADGDAAPHEQTPSRTFTPPESLEEAMRCGRGSQVKEYGSNIFIRFSNGYRAIYDKETERKVDNEKKFCRDLVTFDPAFRNVKLKNNTHAHIKAVMERIPSTSKK